MSGSSDSKQWIFPAVQPTKVQVKSLLAAAVSKGVLEAFRSHTYTFGGRLFKQLIGGAIGLRLTSVVARLRMVRWARLVRGQLQQMGIKVYLFVFYVDDV